VWGREAITLRPKDLSMEREGTRKEDGPKKRDPVCGKDHRRHICRKMNEIFLGEEEKEMGKYYSTIFGGKRERIDGLNRGTENEVKRRKKLDYRKQADR